MNIFEIQLCRRRLDDYGAYKSIMEKAYDGIGELQERIDHAGDPVCPNAGRERSQNHTDLSTKVNNLISKQMELQRTVSLCRFRMAAIEDFLDTFEDEEKAILKSRYVDGQTYESLESQTGLSVSGVKNKIFRILAKRNVEECRKIGVLS